ncbi:MAG TPA: LuxR C-terminal-related transcriptional regulator [Candidatus Methylomirabilis sp.]|nr:LuxR C-terminal-related transcriptional regulator [Candidatus Methylomirabilis sp.]
MLRTAYNALERASSAGPLAPSPGPFRAVHCALRHSTLPLAIFDEHLRCRASNSAFTSLTGASHERCFGKTMDDILGTAVPEFEGALQTVWNSGEPLQEQQIAVRPTNSLEEKQWLVDLLPVSAGSERVGMVIAAFADVTTLGRIENRMLRLAPRHALNARNAFSLGPWQRIPSPEGFVELIQRTVGLLRRSIALRRVFSEMRLAHSLRESALRLGDATYALAILRGPRTLPEASTTGRGAIHPPEALSGFNRPSPRELQVLRFLADGRSNKEIAAALRLSIRTVETYRARLMSKLKVHSAAEVVRYAIRNRFIQP